MREKTPSSAEARQMRDYYKQTKQWCEPEVVDFTTWDGGERHITLTAASVEREIKPHEKFKRYDTLEVYHEHKAKEAEEFENEENEDETQERKLTTLSTRETQKLSSTTTVYWEAMSRMMWNYINQVTVHAHTSQATDPGTSQSSSHTEETNKLLDDYRKYLTEIGQTIEPPTTNFLVERFSRRLSSEEIAKRKLYSKNPNFKERFIRRLDSVELEKRRSRLSTPPTTTTGTWAYTTIRRKRIYSSMEREGINEYFRLNNISTDPYFFGDLSSSPLNSILTNYTRSLDYNECRTYTSYSYDHSIKKSLSDAVDFGTKYDNIDVPIIQSSREGTLTSQIKQYKSENSAPALERNRTLSYKELSSVVSYYAELLRLKEGTRLYFDTSTLIVPAFSKPTVNSVTPSVLSTCHKPAVTLFTTNEPLSHEDAHHMTQPPEQHVFNLLFDPFRHDVITRAPCTPTEDNYEAFIKSLGSSLPTETLHDGTTESDHQLQYTNKKTTPKLYSKAEVYAMGHRTYVHGSHDPLWRSKYGRYKESTTPRKNNNLMNIFDDPLGLYMRPDTEEDNKRRAKLADEEKEREAKAKNDSITAYPYWKELNKKYLASTVTIVHRRQYTPRNENDTDTTEPDQEVIYSEENYIERRATTAPREWTGYHLETTTQIYDPFPDAQEIAKQLAKSEGDPLDPEHILQKRVHDRELEDQVKINEDDMQSASYMNLTSSDQLCVDRAPALQFLDDSKQFESEGFKTMEGFSAEEYDLMEKQIFDEIEETKKKYFERQLNKTREKEEMRRRMSTTTPQSEEKIGLRMDNIKFNHLDTDYQQQDMQDFKKRLKEQFGVIYERSTTKTYQNLYDNTNTISFLTITNKDGRRLKKIKRRKTTKTMLDEFSQKNYEENLLLNTSYPKVSTCDASVQK